jgi:hypothetical protein
MSPTGGHDVLGCLVEDRRVFSRVSLTSGPSGPSLSINGLLTQRERVSPILVPSFSSPPSRGCSFEDACLGCTATQWQKYDVYIILLTLSRCNLSEHSRRFTPLGAALELAWNGYGGYVVLSRVLRGMSIGHARC